MVRISAGWRPYPFSSASEISPTVALARAASIASASRLFPGPPSPAAPSSAAALVRSASAALLCAHPAVLDLQHLDRVVLVDLVLVYADHRLLARVDSRLRAGGGLLDA